AATRGSRSLRPERTPLEMRGGDRRVPSNADGKGGPAMNGDAPGGNRDTLEEAQKTIARQAEEIAYLRRRLAEESAAKELRGVFTQAAAAGAIASPVSHSRLIEMIVETAAHVISAQAAALFLVDEERGGRTFE